MTVLYVIIWVILILILAAYVILAASLRANYSALCSESSVILGSLQIHERGNYIRSILIDSKLILRDLSMMMISAGILFAFLPIDFSVVPSAICAIMAVIDYCHYKSINI
jgi:hypothetical protein